MMRRRLLNGLALMLAVAAPATGASPPAAGASPPARVTSPNRPMVPDRLRSMTLSQIDEALDDFRRMSWRLPEELGNPGSRPDGSSLQADIDLFLQTEATLAEFMRARRRLADGQAPDGTLPIAELMEFNTLVQREACRFYSISGFWGPAEDGSVYHVVLVQTLLDRLPAVPEEFRREFASIRADLRRTREQLEAEVATCGDPARDPIDAMTARARAASARTAALRSALALKIDEAVAAGRLPPRRLERAAPCPAPATASVAAADRNRPALRSFPDAAAHYPAESRLMGVEGTVRVEAMYDAGGCVVSGMVVSTAGADALDEAALRVALLMEMEPAVIDGKPVAGGATLPIRFTLRGVEDVPANQPQP